MRYLYPLAACVLLTQGCQPESSHQVPGADLAHDSPASMQATMQPKLAATTTPSAEDWLGLRLRVIDTPLPTAAELEATLEDPLGVVTALSEGPPSQVTNNAIALLGQFDGSGSLLASIATDQDRSPMARASAVAGLASQPPQARAEARDVLVMLTKDPHTTVAAHATAACAGLPDAAEIFSRLVEDPSTHPTVRRRAQRLLEAPEGSNGRAISTVPTGRKLR